MAFLKAREAPPPDYYATNLLTVLETAVDQYEDVLHEDELGFFHAFQTLSLESRRLLARLLSRKGDIFREERLSYEEVSNLDAALEELRAAGFIERGLRTDCHELLQRFTLKDLRQWFPDLVRQATKETLIDSILSNHDEEQIHHILRKFSRWIELKSRSYVDMYSLLFFGNRYSDLSAFVLRDLGLVVYEKYILDKEHRIFPDRAVLDRYLAIVRSSEAVAEVGKDIECDDARAFIEDLKTSESVRLLERTRNRVLNEIGRNLERRQVFDLALQAYEHAYLPPARERRVRIHKRMGDEVATKSLLQEIINTPWTAEERQFAQQFGSRRKRNAGIPVVSLTLDGDPVDSIEHHAISVLRETGKTALHLENQFPMGLFALAYWDWIFAPVQGAFVNAFQAAPLDLFWQEFFEVRTQECEDPLADTYPLLECMRETSRRKRGLANVLIDWNVWDQDFVAVVIERVPVRVITTILRIVVNDLTQMRSGFPDLTVLNDEGEVEFIEVKGPGDQLQPNQRIWFSQMLGVGLPAHVMRFTRA